MGKRLNRHIPLKSYMGSLLVVSWVPSRAFTAVTRVRSPVGELGFRKLQDTAKINQNFKKS